MNSIELNFESFYPLDSLQLRQVKEDDQTIVIRLKSITSTCECPHCQVISTPHHGPINELFDLPILGKNVQLEVTTHEYQCLNFDCSVTTFSENFSHFLDSRSRMTERCRSFICDLALETSCKGRARNCQLVGLNVSGDTVIRVLLRRFKEQDQLFTGAHHRHG